VLENVREPWKPREVLLGIYRCDGEATTPEIAELIELNGQQIRYQLRRNLEPAGYVITEQPESTDGVTPPKRMQLTEQGETMAEQIVDERDGEQDIESTLSTVSGELEELTARVGALENQVADEDMKAEVSTIRQGIESVSAEVDEIQAAKYGALSDEAITEMAKLKASNRTFIEFVKEVLDMEDELLPLAKKNNQDVFEEMGISEE
jgi:predicted ArsR family transcriptional regulator